jgi:hypothetical protein
MSRTILIVSLMFVGVLTAATLRHIALPEHSRIDRAKLEQVRPGMARTQIEGLLGVPPGDYTTGPSVGGPSSAVWFLDYEAWWCDEGVLLVRFEEDRAIDVQVFGVLRLPKPRLLDGLRAWLGV